MATKHAYRLINKNRPEDDLKALINILNEGWEIIHPAFDLNTQDKAIILRKGQDKPTEDTRTTDEMEFTALTSKLYRDIPTSGIITPEGSKTQQIEYWINKNPDSPLTEWPGNKATQYELLGWLRLKEKLKK